MCVGWASERGIEPGAPAAAAAAALLLLLWCCCCCCCCILGTCLLRRIYMLLHAFCFLLLIW